MPCEASLDHARARLQRRGRLPSSPLQRRAAWWTFGQVAVVEPPHTAAERARRPGGRWRQGSCGPQCAAGSRCGDRMLTVGATLQQPQRTILASLPTACDAALRGEPAPSLRPAHAPQAHAAA
jgi:hypothetical protein